MKDKQKQKEEDSEKKRGDSHSVLDATGAGLFKCTYTLTSSSSRR